jgi:aspartate kinase
MGTIVQKYGGSSVSTPTKLQKVAQRIVETRQLGHKVVVVVSAMGDTTNQLLSLAKEVSPQPQRRELDMLLTVGERISMSLLSMAIQDLGAPAVSFTGSQSGIITTHTHTNARIIKVKPTRVLKALEDDYIVIIAGFQGVSEKLEITSLGRGGSDTTAVAMAAALNAEFVEICSDVDGVYSTDPRVVPQAYKVGEMSYEEMQMLADSGAKVLNAEAIEWAKRSGIEVRCVATDDPQRSGTVIKVSKDTHHEVHHHPQLSAITLHPGLMKVQGSANSSESLCKCLHKYGVIDAHIYWLSNSKGPQWSCWIPILNLHQPEQIRRELYTLGAQVIEDEWSWVTLVGRSLLGAEAPNRSNTKEDERMKPSSTLLNQITQTCDESEISVTPLSFTPHALRWAVPLSDASKLVQLLHARYLNHLNA